MITARTILRDALWRWGRGIAHALLFAGVLAGMVLGTVSEGSAAIFEATATAADTTTSTSDVVMTGMTLTPGAGDYLVAFSTTVNASAAATVYASIYVNGVQQAHTERRQFQETSIVSFDKPLMTYAHVSVGAGQAIDIRWRTTAGTATASARTLNLFPVASADVSQVTATADTTLNSATYTQLGSMTLSPAAGTYLAIFSTSADGPSGAIIDTSLFVGGTQVAHTERSNTQEASIPNTAFAHGILAKVTPSAGQAVEVRWRNSGTAGTMTAHQRTLTLYKVDPANIFEATATADATSTATADALLDSMTLTPGAGSYLGMFSSTVYYATGSDTARTYFSLYVNAVKTAHTERQPINDGSLTATNIPVATNGIVSPGAGQAVELQWGAVRTDPRIARERTLVLVREASGVTPATLSSAASQSFTVGQAAATASTLTVTDSSTPTITATNNLRIRIPAGLNMIWDTSVTSVTLGGTAWTPTPKVSATGVTYEDSNKTAVLDVTSNFAASDTLTIAGLKFTSFTGTSSATSLQLVVAGTGGATAATDDKTITIGAAVLNNFLVEAAGGGSIGTQTAGTPFSIKLTARDASNNTLTSFTGTVSITSTGTLSAGGGTTAAFTAGVLTSHSVTISNAGSFTITATKTAGTENGTSNAFTVNAAPPPAFSNGYTYRRNIDITDAQVSSGPHTNFPMLFCVTLADLKTTANGGKVTDAQGDDIIFTASDGTTQLAHEVEKYDATTGELLVWVRVPSLASSSQIYIYYGNSAVTTFQGNVTSNGVTGVWDSNYKGVWHLKEDPAGTAPSMKDSTSNAKHGSMFGSMTSGNQVAGKVNGSLTFDGTDDRIQVGSIIGNSTAFTMSLWFKHTGTTGPRKIMAEGNTGTTTPILYISVNETAAGDVQFGIRDDANLGTGGITKTGTYNDNAWHHVAAVQVSKSSRILYVDGVSQGTNAITIGTITLNTGNIGAINRTTIHHFFPGGVDEARISNTARSAGWIQTEYNNQSSCSGFYTVGAEELNTSSNPASFLVEAAGGGSIPAQISGTPFSIRITALDGSNNTLTSFTGTVDITSTGTLSAGGGTTAAFTAGVLTSHSVTISNAGTFTITATKTAGTENGTSNAFTVNFSQPAFVSGYLYRRLIDITDAQVSSGPHSNFPMLFCVTLADLKTTANGGKVTDAQGDDIVFAASDGTTQLSHQVEKYDATTGELLVWVRVPSLASTTQLYLYYGNSAVTTFQGSVPGSVWNVNFRMVHHLSETSGQHNDSTSNNSDSTSVSVATQGSTAGKINRADVFSAASSHQVQVASSTWFDIVSGDLTVEAWVKTSSSSTQFIVNRKTDAGAGWQLITGNTTAGAPEFWVYDNTPGTAGHKAQAVSGTAVNNNVFRYLVGRWTAGSKTAEIFIDGSPSASATASSFAGVAITRPLVMGAEGDTTPGFFFDGTLDEVRLSNSARSNGWILTSYNNQNSCAGFYTVGAEESSLVTPGHFNAYETSTVAGAITGDVYTKLAGVAVSIDMIALNQQKIAINTTFTGTVKVEVLDTSNNSGALDANACRSSWTVIQTLTNPTFTDGRDAISFTVANAYPNVRLRISYPATGSPTLIGCTTDNFSIRPSSLTVTSTNATNSTTSGTPTFKTGANFNLTATANVAGYNGTPEIDNTKVAGTPTAGTIGGGFGAAAAGTGIATGDSFFYSEVGNFGLNAGGVRDTTFTSVDQAAGDCVPSTTSNTLSGGKYGCWVGSTATAATAFGRFIPDNFNVAYATPPVFGTGCGTFTYVGTKFIFANAVMTVTARNGTNNGLTNATTTNYEGAYVKLTTASLNQAPYNTQAGRYTRFDALGGGATPALDLSALPATTADPTVGTFNNGVGTLTFSAGATGLGFVRSATTPSAPFDADIALALNVIDTDGVIFAGNPASFGAATAGNGIAFSGGKPMRFGRLVIGNASGTQLLPLPVRVEAQYWSGAPANAFITNTLDNCTSIAPANVAMGNYTGTLSACNTAISGGGALGMGRKILLLAAPGASKDGSVTLTVNLGASASGNTCTAVGAGPGAGTTAANLPHLQGNWTGGSYDVNPSARATFGVYRGAEEVVHVRENF